MALKMIYHVYLETSCEKRVENETLFYTFYKKMENIFLERLFYRNFKWHDISSCTSDPKMF